MQDVDRSRGAESQAALKAPRVVHQPTERLVSVREALLGELRDYQGELDNYVRGYIASRELSVRCERIRSWLERAAREPQRLEDPLYWEGVRDLLDGVSPQNIVLAHLFRSDFNDSVVAISKALEEAKIHVSAAMRPPQQGDPKEIVSTVHRSTDQMRDEADNIAVQCRQKAEETLGQLETCIARIFERIEAAKEQLVSESSGGPVGYEAKIQRDAIRREKQFRGPATPEAPGREGKVLKSRPSAGERLRQLFGKGK